MTNYHQPEAGTAGFKATPLTNQLTCCLAAGMDDCERCLLPAWGFYLMAL